MYVPVHRAYLFGTAYLALSSLYYVNDASVWHVGSSTALGALAYAILINSCVVYLIIAWANKHSNPVQIVAFVPLQVPATVILSKLLLGQNDWQPRDAVGCACVIVGLACVSYAQFQSQHAKEPELLQVSSAVESALPSLGSGRDAF